MSKQSETIAYNTARLHAFVEQQTRAAKTGGTCPKCGGGVNPTILEHFGHCLACQSASIGLTPNKEA
jgi:ssDNA-binding Zn-finger/Zn-ribbon topoisomerase 1